MKGGGGVRPGFIRYGAWPAAGYEELSPAPPEVMTDGSKTHPLTNLEQHVQRVGLGNQENTEGEGRTMPVRNEGKQGREGGDDQGTTRIRTAVSEDPENLKRQQRTGPSYGPRHLWQRVEFWGRGRASGQKHQVTQVQALGVRRLG